MKRSLLFFVILLAGLSGSLFAQSKVVTNADLEKFRAERLKAEREYRENYARLGMPSPEELEKRRLESAERMRAEIIERDRLEAARQQLEGQYYYMQPQYAAVPQYSSPYILNYLPYGNYNTRTYRPQQKHFQQYGPGNVPLPTLGPPRYDFLPGSILPSGRRH